MTPEIKRKKIMKAKLYVDTVAAEPLLAIQEETLSDGSKVFNLCFKGFESIPCIDEDEADRAFDAIASALKAATNDNVASQRRRAAWHDPSNHCSARDGSRPNNPRN